MKKVTVIGMGMSPKDLTDAHLDLIRSADVLVGGKRHLDAFKDTPAKKMAITKQLSVLVNSIKKAMQSKKVVVLASGDPLYYGIGPRLINALGAQNVIVHPNVNSVAAAFARIGKPWQDVQVVSLHGRGNEQGLLESLSGTAPVAVFTDLQNTPARIAGKLLSAQISGYDMWVCEQMGTDHEKVKRYTLRGAARGKFTSPNMVVLLPTTSAALVNAKLSLGIPDHLFVHERGLITKAEVRTVSLSKLQLEAKHVLWDIGAGSGSIAIEASLFVTRGKIIAIEKNADRVNQVVTNLERFNVANVKVVRAEYPVDSVRLPAPDRIFIGGAGRNLRAVIKAGASRLKKNGRMVINTVLLANIDAAVKALQQAGFATEVVQVQVSRSKDMPWSARMEAQNPVWIITGQREK